METKSAHTGLILLIMYDRLQVSAFTEKLRGYGYDDLEVCFEGKTALEKLKQVKPAVIISDVELKGELNGIETGKKIRDQYELPLIYMSRLQDEKTFQRARETQPQAFLNKPVNWNELRIAIESARIRNEEKASLNTKLEEYSQWFEKAPVSYLILDEGGNINAVNKTWTELTGYSSDEITGKWFGDIIPAGSHQAFNQCIADLVKKGSIHDLEFQLIKKDGQKITIALEGKLNYGLRGEVIPALCIITDITEKQRIKFKLEESEERFRLLFEEAPLGYQSLSRDGGLIYVNKTWCEMLGYYKKEVIGKWFGDFLTPEDKEKFRTDFSVLRQKGSAHDIQYTMIKKDGSIIYVSTDSKVRNDEKGNYIQSHCIIKDITAQKLAEDKLHESEKQFRNLIESAGDIIYILDSDLKYLYGNNQYLKRRGLTREELIGKEYGDFHSNERLNEFKNKIMAVYRSGNPIRYEYQSEEDGKYFLRTLSPIIDPETKEIESITVISREITDRKNAEEILRKRENEIRTITDNIPALVSYVDANGHYRFINHQYEKWFGIPSDEIIGKHYREVLGEITYEQIKEYVNKALSGKRIIYDDELSYVHGGKRWVTAEYIPDFDEKGKVSGFFALVTDITERKRAEVQLRASEERYRGLANSITDVFFAMDKDLKYTFWNEASEKLTGIPEQQAIGKHLREIFPDTPQLKKTENIYRSVLKNRKATNLINDFNLGDRDFVFEISAYPAGEGISVIVKDITERKKIESELYKSRQMLQIVLDTIPAGVFWKDRDLFYRGGNHTFLNAFGLNYSGEVNGKTDYDFPWNKDLANSFREQDKRIMESGIPEYDIIESVTLNDGTQSWARTNKVPMQDTEGNIIGILGIYEDITERKQAEQALQISQSRLANAMEIARLGYWEYDVAKDIFTFDDHFYSIFHTSAKQVGGYTMSSARYAELFVHPKDRYMVGLQIQKVLESTDPDYSRHLEHRIIYADGKIGWVSVRFFIDKDAQGRTIRTFGVNQDITERKKTEKALEESEVMLRSINENINDIIFKIDKDAKITYLSPSVKRILGYKPEEITGQPILNFIAKEYHSSAAKNIEARTKQKRGRNLIYYEYDMVARDGRKIPIEVSSSAIRDEQGNLVGFAGVTRDISERKKAESDLLVSETRFKAFMDNLPVMTYIKNKDGKYIYGNKAVLKFAGKTTNQFIDTKVSDYLSANLAKRMNQMDKKVLITDKAVELDEWRYVKGDVERWFTEYKFPIFISEEEKLIGGWIMDITRRKMAEFALKESEKLYKDLVEKAGIAIMTDDVNGNIKFFNREFTRLFGYTALEMKKQSLENLLTKKDIVKVTTYHMLRMKGEKAPDQYEVRGFRKNGTEIWIEIKTTVLEDNSKITGTRNYMWDITEKKKIQVAVEDSEIRFRELFSNMTSGVAIYEFDPEEKDFIFKDINKSGITITGIKNKKEVIGKHLLECFPGVKEFGLWDVLLRVNDSGRAEKVPNILYKDHRIDLYVENFVYKLNTGELVAVFDDIGERVLAEQSLLRSYGEVRKLSQHLENIREEERKYIAGELHDELGQILTAVKMDVSWIRNKMPPERKGIKKRVGSTIQIIDEAIRSVQRLSLELRPRMLDDLGLFETLKAYFSEYESWAKIAIRYKFPQQEPEMIPGQDISFFRIIQESLTNIARHADASEVEVVVKERNDLLKLKIHDNGIGIPDEKVYSSESFGILNMRERIERWGGRFEIKGEKGTGTTIMASIPIGKVKT